MCVCVRVGVCVRASVALAQNPVASFGFSYEGLADVHAVLLRLQVLIIALVFVVTVVRRGVAGEGWGGGHRCRARVPEPR